MAFIGFCVVMAIIAAIVICYNQNTSGIDSWTIIILLPLIIGAIAYVIAMVIGCCLPTVNVANQPVYSLHGLYDDSDLNGRFFLGSGYVNEEETYHFRYLDHQGASIARNVPAELEIPLVRTFEEEQDNPYLITYHEEFSEPWMSLIGVLANPGRLVQYDFHIPVNSIDGTYTIR